MSDIDNQTFDARMDRLDKYASRIKLAVNTIWALFLAVFILGMHYKGTLDRIDDVESWRGQISRHIDETDKLREERWIKIVRMLERIGSKLNIRIEGESP